MSIRRQLRKFYRTFARANCLSIFLSIVIIVFVLFSKYDKQHTEFTDILNTKCVVGKQAVFKDSYYLVTAISSREFKWLLQFIDGVMNEDGLELIIWSLNLRDCELSYLNNLKTPFRIHLHRFLYHFHPLHIRSYGQTAIKPIVIHSSAITFGEVIWIEPSGRFPLPIKDVILHLNDKGFIAGSTDEAKRDCRIIAIGVNYIQYKPFLERWVECAKNNTCISNILDENNAKNGVDMLFEQFRRGKRIPCVSIKSSDVPPTNIFNHWESNKKELCPLKKACVLTGNKLCNKELIIR